MTICLLPSWRWNKFIIIIWWWPLHSPPPSPLPSILSKDYFLWGHSTLFVLEALKNKKSVTQSLTFYKMDNLPVLWRYNVLLWFISPSTILAFGMPFICICFFFTARRNCSAILATRTEGQGQTVDTGDGKIAKWWSPTGHGNLLYMSVFWLWTLHDVSSLFIPCVCILNKSITIKPI